MSSVGSDSDAAPSLADSLAPPRWRRLVPVLALITWTAIVWTSRIRNVLANDELTDVGRTGRIMLASSFLALALAPIPAIVAYLRSPADRLASRLGALRGLATVLAGWTIAVWVVRGLMIGFGDWSVAFKLIHSALAATSIGLGAWVLAWARRSRIL
ncbi:MAG: hypothetical protein AAF467_11095 [Actinomycetota bacterium]